MSKLEKQAALPRRRIFRSETEALVAIHGRAGAGLIALPKRVRKAKKAKGKR